MTLRYCMRRASSRRHPLPTEASPDGDCARARCAALVAGGAGRDVGERHAAGHARAALARRARRDCCPASPCAGASGCSSPSAGRISLRSWPAGPALALANGFDCAGPGSWCVAQPVHLAAGLDHLRLAPLAQAALTDEDASALGALVSSHFATRRSDRRGIRPGRMAAALHAPHRLLDSAAGRRRGPQRARLHARGPRRRARPQPDERDPDAAARASGQRSAASGLVSCR